MRERGPLAVVGHVAIGADLYCGLFIYYKIVDDKRL